MNEEARQFGEKRDPMMGHSGIASRIERALAKSGGAASVTYLDRRGQTSGTTTPDQLLAGALIRALALERRFSTGSIVLLMMPPGPEFLLSLLGCFYAGVVAVPVPDLGLSNSMQRLDGIVSDARPAGVLCTRSNSRMLLDHFGNQANAPDVLVMDDMCVPSAIGGEGRVPVCAGLRQSAQETVLVQYTSGSTRQPRGVALSGSNIVNNADLVSRQWGLSADKDLLVNWLPHHHDMGLMGGLLYPLLMGGPSVQMSPMAFMQHPINWLKTISQFRATVSGGPAFAFGLCLEVITEEEIEQLDLSCWNTAFCGAEPVPAALLREFRSRLSRTGLKPHSVFSSYGLAEATLLVAGHPGRKDEDGNNDGAVLEACRLDPEMRKDLCIVDPETCVPVAEGARGEIWVKGPSVATGGYLGGSETMDPDPFSGATQGSPQRFLRTGDLGWIGTAGLHISGRQKDVLIANGANIAAVDVEWMAAEINASLNPLAAAAVSVRRDGPDDAALVIEVKTEGATIPNPEQVASQIRRAVRSAYGIELHLISFVKRGCLERTTSGKVRRQAVSERLRTGHRYPEAIA